MTVDEVLGHLGTLIVLAGLVVCSAFFSGSETALFSLTRAELLKFQTGKGRVDRAVAALMHDPRRLLMVLLLGNQVVNVAFFAVFAVLIATFEAGWLGTLVLMVVELLLIVLLGEVAPKSVAIASPARFARIIALPLHLLVRVLGPVQGALRVALVDPLTRLLSPGRPVAHSLTSEELASLVELSRQRRLIAPHESDWLRQVIELNRLKVADIMVPRVDMVAYDLDAPREGLVELFCRTGLAKIPVYRGDVDDTRGVIYAKAVLLDRSAPLKGLVRPVPYVPETATVDKLLLQFRRTGTQMAIVVDEYGGTAGLVSVEDALEEIVGDILAPDEPPEPPVRRLGPDEYLIEADEPIHDWAETFGIQDQVERVSTLGGLVMSLLGHVPKVGETARLQNLEFSVEAMRRHRIHLLRVRLRGDGSAPPAAEGLPEAGGRPPEGGAPA